MDQTSHWMQVGKPMAEIAQSSYSIRPVQERKVRPQKDQALNCPRCNSTNTKFCYYNNYSLTQPRYFCKTCRRYWTEGGTLRNVPVGGGSRRTKKLSSSSEVSSKVPDHTNPPSFLGQNPNKIHVEGQDLNLAFVPNPMEYNQIPQFIEFPKMENGNNVNMSSSLFGSSFPFQERKASIGLSLDGLENRFGNGHNVLQVSNGSMVMFPFGAMKQQTSTSRAEEDKGQEGSNGFWNGMLGGGSW